MKVKPVRAKAVIEDENYIGDKVAIKNHYDTWANIKNLKKLKQVRGYELEKIIYSILINEELNPKKGLRNSGEQIDGAFLFDNLPFLIEAKWQKNPIPASKLYEFKGKVDGKFHLTSGIFISISGYSTDAPIALIKGKVANIILFDKSDIEKVIYNNHTFVEVLKFKLERAAFYGDSSVAFKGKKLAIADAKTIKIIDDKLIFKKK